MPTPRKLQVDISVTAHYHCISRCVRQAYLCGKNKKTGQSFDHRKAWLVEKMKTLTEFFAIEICAYAVMSDHYHLVLRVDQEKALNWSASEVVTRWAGLFRMSKAPELIEAGFTRSLLKENEELIEKWRSQLYEIGWFMRVLNEGIARQANKEDNCKGRFWEGRFKSQALLDEAAILTCMAYVDLNPVRAKISDTPETSDFTSIQERIRAIGKQQPKTLAPLETKYKRPNTLPISLTDYIELVDESGRLIREGKRGSISEDLAPILTRLGINHEFWVNTLQHLESNFESFIGTPQKMKWLQNKRGKQHTRGSSAAKRIFLNEAA